MDILSYNKKKIGNDLNFNKLPLDFIDILKKHKIEHYFISLRSSSGVPKIELCLITDELRRQIYTYKDFGYYVKFAEVEIRSFVDRQSRNKEICRLYYEENLSQAFLGNFFHLSQPTVSLIVKQEKSLK